MYKAPLCGQHLPHHSVFFVAGKSDWRDAYTEFETQNIPGEAMRSWNSAPNYSKIFCWFVAISCCKQRLNDNTIIEDSWGSDVNAT